MTDKILFIGTTKPVLDSDDLTTKFSKLGRNTGNMVYTNAVHQSILFDKNHMYDIYAPTNIEDFSKKHNINIDKFFDRIVIVCANQIPSDPYLHTFHDVLLKTNLPITVLGIGAQSDLNNNELFLNKYDEKEAPKWNLIVQYRSFFKMLENKGSLIGTRGHFTTNIINKMGITNNLHTIGCPSWYYKGDKLNVKKIKPFSKNLKVSLSFDLYRDNNLQQDFIIKLGLLLPNATFIHQGTSEIDFVHGYTELERDAYKLPTEVLAKYNLKTIKDPNKQFSSILKSISTMYNLKRVRDKSKMFFNINEWYNFAKQQDVYFGSRIHGCIIHIQAGVPSILICHDSRTLEFAKLFKIPHVLVTDLINNQANIINKFEEIYNSYDHQEMIDNYPVLYNNYKHFLDKAGIKYNI